MNAKICSVSMPSACAQVGSSAERQRIAARNALARIGIHIPMAMGKMGSFAGQRILSQAGTGGEQRPRQSESPRTQKIPGLNSAEVGGFSKGIPGLRVLLHTRRLPRLRP